MLKKGVNSYVTLAEADRYIRSRYDGTDPLRLTWDTLSDDRSRYRYLIRACDMIEALRFPGRKSNELQGLSWPRDGRSTVPDAIRHAQAEIALWDAQRASDGTTGGTSRANLIAQGVKSYSIGDLSETLDGSTVAEGAMECQAAAMLLRPLLGGGFSMC